MGTTTLHDAIVLGEHRVKGDEMVVVQIHAPGSQVAGYRDRFCGGQQSA